MWDYPNADRETYTQTQAGQEYNATRGRERERERARGNIKGSGPVRSPRSCSMGSTGSTKEYWAIWQSLPLRTMCVILVLALFVGTCI